MASENWPFSFVSAVKKAMNRCNECEKKISRMKIFLAQHGLVRCKYCGARIEVELKGRVWVFGLLAVVFLIASIIYLIVPMKTFELALLISFVTMPFLVPSILKVKD